MPPLRRADRALTRPAGALLAPRLLVAAGDEAARLGLVRTLPLIGEVSDHRPVERRLVHRAVEQGRGQRQRFLLGACGGEMGRLNHGGSCLPACARLPGRSEARGPRRARTAGLARGPLCIPPALAPVSSAPPSVPASRLP